LLVSDCAYELERTVDQHPPEVRGLALDEQGDAGLDRHLVASRHQIAELTVGQPVEEPQLAYVVGPHQIVAR
jgi:hypothetical protein